MAAPLDIVAPTTIANYALGALDGAAINIQGFKHLREKADWEYDVGGTTLDGVLEGGYERPIISAPGMDLTPFMKSIVRYARYSLPWGEVAGVKTLDLGALRRNTGKQALVKFRDKEIPAMLKSMLERTDGVWYQFLNQNIASPSQADGNAVTGLPLAGLPSFLLKPGTTSLKGSDGALSPTYTGSNVAAGDKEAVSGNGETYAGLSLAQNGVTGIDYVMEDAWRPTLVNTSSTAWTGSANTTANINYWLQHLSNKMNRFAGSGGSDLRPDPMTSGWLSYDFHQALQAFVAAQQKAFLSPAVGIAAPQVPLGTNSDAIPFANMMWHWDFQMPSATAYVIPWQHVFARCQTLFPGIEGPGNPLGKDGEEAGIIETAITYDPIRRQWIVTGTSPLQFVCMPRYFGRAGAYA